MKIQAELRMAKDEELSQEDSKSKGYLIALIRVADVVKIYGSSTDRDDCDEILEINGRSFVGKTLAEHYQIVDHVRECIKLRNIQVKINRSSNKPTKVDGEANNHNVNCKTSLNNNGLNILARTQIATTTNQHHCNIKGARLSLDHERKSVLPSNQENNNNNNNNIFINNKRKESQQQQEIVPILLDVFVIGSNAQYQLERFFKLTNIHPHNQNNLKLILSTTADQCRKKLAAAENQNNRNQNKSPATNNQAPPLTQIKSQSNDASGKIFTHKLNDHKTTTTIEPETTTMLDNNQMKPRLSEDKSKLLDDKLKTKSKDEGANTTKKKKTSISQDAIMLESPDNNSLTSGDKANDRILMEGDVVCSDHPQIAGLDLTNLVGRLVENLNCAQLGELIKETNLLKLFGIYQTIITSTNGPLKKPMLTSGSINGDLASGVTSVTLNDLLNNVIHSLRFNFEACQHLDADSITELLSILCRHDLEAICGSFDQLTGLLEYSTTTTTPINKQSSLIDQQQQTMTLANQSRENVEEVSKKQELELPIRGETCDGLVRRVHIDKSSNKALGATIKNNGRKVVIGRVVYGGLAQKSGLLAEGDEILEVNGVSMQGKNIDQVVELIEAMEGTLSLTLKIKADADLAACPREAKLDHLNSSATISSDLSKPIARRATPPTILVANSNNTFENLRHHQIIFVRAFFDFDGQQDEFVPCKELALSFQKGEILSIIDQSDDFWWQANRQLDEQIIDSEYQNGSDSFRLAGLIPSVKNIGQRKQIAKNQQQQHLNSTRENSKIMDLSSNQGNQHNKEAFNYYHEDDDYDILETKKNLMFRLFNCPTSVVPPKRRAPTTTPAVAQNNQNKTMIECKDQNTNPAATGANLHNRLITQQGFNLMEQIPAYEEVELFYPKRQMKRPIIFVGPKMIGQRDLIMRLIGEQPTRFASPISHTTRPQLANERDGLDFNFVARDQFESEMRAGKFIECGQYQSQYYGTSFEAINAVAKSGKTCLHLISIPSIFNFHHGKAGCELKPFLVFVRPQDCREPDKLRNLIAAFSPNGPTKDQLSNNRKQQLRQTSNNNQNNLNQGQLDSSARSIIEEVNLIENHLLAYFDLVINVTTDIERTCRELLLELDKVEREPQWIPKFWLSKI